MPTAAAPFLSTNGARRGSLDSLSATASGSGSGPQGRRASGLQTPGPARLNRSVYSFRVRVMGRSAHLAQGKPLAGIGFTVKLYGVATPRIDGAIELYSSREEAEGELRRVIDDDPQLAAGTFIEEVEIEFSTASETLRSTSTASRR
jgi:hypothetical protein